MKELTTTNSQENPIEIIKPIKKELTKLGNIRKIKGHKLFCYYQGKVTEVLFEQSDVSITDISTKDIKVEHKVTIIPGARYVQKLNLKNAIKYFTNHGLIITQ